MSPIETPDGRFEDLPGDDYDPRFVDVGCAEMAYVDEGARRGRTRHGGSRHRDALRETIPTASAQPDVWIEGAGHFLREEAGEEVAEHIVDFVDRT